jgi:hypothetical protein
MQNSCMLSGFLQFGKQNQACGALSDNIRRTGEAEHQTHSAGVRNSSRKGKFSNPGKTHNDRVNSPLERGIFPE